eukprot:TRINITY_DN1606_c0_g1_i1.p2 TRINITY_DN1606_c0_g1~~TRINITY_DN1606_c0_g1_i1.p2  ORF type:complete len:396 (-),score=133.11 TRINITY_DN1606_c0_g1_i1:105-1154(-)
MAAKEYPIYPVGTPGQAWGEEERKQWLQRQTSGTDNRSGKARKFDYFAMVLSRLTRLTTGEVFQYGALDYRPFGSALFPLMGIKSKQWSKEKLLITVTGGTHGYEHSGFFGALAFAEQHLERFSARFNVLVLPAQSPWGFEMEHRWNPHAVDPNRQYRRASPNPLCEEACATMRCIEEHAKLSRAHIGHFDLHDTTDTDNSLFSPTKFARDGVSAQPWHEIPLGFYGVYSSATPSEPEPEVLAFAKATIAGVAATGYPIAPSDEHGNIIGEKAAAEGILVINGKEWGINGAHTDAKYAITTECYPQMPQEPPYNELAAPDPRFTLDKCNAAQVGCIEAGIEYIIKVEQL